MNKEYWQAVGIRAGKTAAQTALSLIGTNAMGVTEVDWVMVASAATLAAITSVLTSWAFGIPEADMATGKHVAKEEG